jgi:hypothetical protein
MEAVASAVVLVAGELCWFWSARDATPLYGKALRQATSNVLLGFYDER